MALLITSLQNPQIKQLVRLRQRREREDSGLILIEGARELHRALQAGVVLEQLFLCPQQFSPEAQALNFTQQPHTELSPAAFEKVSLREHPDGVLGLALTPEPSGPSLGLQALVIVLHGLEKPGNLGAILRTAEAVQADAVLVLGRGADPYNPQVIRASQGSVFQLPVLSWSEEEARQWLSEQHFQTFACTPDAERTYWEAEFRGRVALLLGTEHRGLPQHWRQQQGVRIPMLGQGDSLNVATAAALILYECVRQRQQLSAERGMDLSDALTQL